MSSSYIFPCYFPYPLAPGFGYVKTAAFSVHSAGIISHETKPCPEGQSHTNIPPRGLQRMKEGELFLTLISSGYQRDVFSAVGEFLLDSDHLHAVRVNRITSSDCLCAQTTLPSHTAQT